MKRGPEKVSFELRVCPRAGESYGLELCQAPVGHGNGFSKVERLFGDQLRQVIDQVLSAVKASGYRATDLRRSRQTPFKMKEEPGVRLGLLFLAVKPLRKLSRISAVSDRVRAMEIEELYYWYSKCTSKSSGRRARRSLRLLMAEE